jgi:hypothetical protein
VTNAVNHALKRKARFMTGAELHAVIQIRGGPGKEGQRLYEAARIELADRTKGQRRRLKKIRKPKAAPPQ